jgi:hypothetical protein
MHLSAHRFPASREEYASIASRHCPAAIQSAAKVARKATAGSSRTGLQDRAGPGDEAEIGTPKSDRERRFAQPGLKEVRD